MDLQIGSYDNPDYSLTLVTDLVVGPQGEVYVAQPLDRTVRVYDATGRFLRALGRGGAGPGEFADPYAVGLRSDTLWVADRRLQRITLFSRDGDFLATVTPVPRLRPSWDGVEMVGLLDDGSILAVPFARLQLLASGVVTRVPLSRLAWDGAVLDTLTWIDVAGTLLAIDDPSTGCCLYRQQPFSDAPLYQLAPDGSAVVVVDRRVEETSYDNQYRVTKLSPSGEVVYSKEYGYTAVRLDKARVERWISNQVERRRAAGRGTPTFESALRAALHIPTHEPPVAALVVAGDGTVWLQGPRVPSGMATWTVLSAEGNTLGTVDLPEDVNLFDVRGQLVWGVQYDELEVPFLLRYRLEG